MTYQKIYIARSQGLIGLAIAAFLSLVIDVALFKSLGNKQLIPAIILVLMALAALFAMIGFGRMAFFPPVLYEVSPEGLNSYFNAEKGQLRPIGTLIPWNKIRKISPYQNGKIAAVKVELEPKHNLPVDILSIVRPTEDGKEQIDWANTVFLRAETDFGSLEELVAEFEAKRASYQ